MFIQSQTELLYTCQLFHCPTCIESLELDCNIEYINANQGIILESNKIWIQYNESEENDLNNSGHGLVHAVVAFHFGWTPSNQNL